MILTSSFPGTLRVCLPRSKDIIWHEKSEFDSSHALALVLTSWFLQKSSTEGLHTTSGKNQVWRCRLCSHRWRQFEIDWSRLTCTADYILRMWGIQHSTGHKREQKKYLYFDVVKPQQTAGDLESECFSFMIYSNVHSCVLDVFTLNTFWMFKMLPPYQT